MLSVARELVSPLFAQNLRGLAVWELVAEAQHYLEQAEDWEVMQFAGGECVEQLELANHYGGLIGAELKRRSQFVISAKAQASNVELHALKELAVDNSFVDLIGHYVDITVISGSYKFTCPIHGDDHPSGQLYPSQGKWWCFGCSKGGDIFDALMVYGRLSFGEAVSLLGRYFGLKTGRGSGE